MKKSVQQLVKYLKACFTDRQSTERRRPAEPVLAEFIQTILRRERRSSMISVMQGFFLVKNAVKICLSEEGTPV